MKIPSIFPYIIGCIAGFVAFSGNFNIPRNGIWLLGLGCYAFILLVEFFFSRIKRSKKDAEEKKA